MLHSVRSISLGYWSVTNPNAHLTEGDGWQVLTLTVTWWTGG